MAVPAGLRALRHRNFQLFFGGQLISLVGTWMQTVAQSWLVYQLTGSALLLMAGGDKQESVPVFVVTGIVYSIDGLFGKLFAVIIAAKKVLIAAAVAAAVVVAVAARDAPVDAPTVRCDRFRRG